MICLKSLFSALTKEVTLINGNYYPNFSFLFYLFIYFYKYKFMLLS